MNRNFAGNVGIGGKPVVGGAEKCTDLALADIDPLLTDKEIARIFGCGRSTIWRWVSDGTMPKPLKIGGMSRWRKSAIDALIENAEAEALAA